MLLNQPVKWEKKTDVNALCKPSFSNSYTSPDDGGDVDNFPSLTIQQANRKLERLVVQLNAAINGNDVNLGSGDDEDEDGSSSGSGMSGSGESGEEETESEGPTTPEIVNEIVDEPNDEEGVMAGGVVKKVEHTVPSSAQRQLLELWSLSLTLCILSMPVIA